MHGVHGALFHETCHCQVWMLATLLCVFFFFFSLVPLPSASLLSPFTLPSSLSPQTAHLSLDLLMALPFSQTYHASMTDVIHASASTPFFTTTMSCETGSDKVSLLAFVTATTLLAEACTWRETHIT